MDGAGDASREAAVDDGALAAWERGRPARRTWENPATCHGGRDARVPRALRAARDRDDRLLRESVEADEQQDRDGGQAGAEAPPQSDDAHVAVEAEVEGDGEADQPVADEVGGEREGRVAGAAKDAGADGLQSVGELEDGGERRTGTAAAMTFS